MVAGGVLALKTMTVLLNGRWWLWNVFFLMLTQHILILLRPVSADRTLPRFLICWSAKFKFFSSPLYFCCRSKDTSYDSHEEVLFLSNFLKKRQLCFNLFCFSGAERNSTPTRAWNLRVDPQFWRDPPATNKAHRGLFPSMFTHQISKNWFRIQISVHHQICLIWNMFFAICVWFMINNWYGTV